MRLRQLVRHPFARHLYAIVLVALAAVLRMAILHGRAATHPWLIFYPVVVVAAVFGGLSAGLLAIGFACAIVLWPLFAGEPHLGGNADWLGMTVFILTGSMISAVCEVMRRTRARVDIYHTLVNSLDEGFCVVEMLYDPNGKPVDYRFLEYNPAFEKHTGLGQARGKTIREMVPNHEDHWIEIYGRVARTGEEIRFEQPAAAMHRYYNVFAFRVGGERSDKVGILFKDITEHRNNEQKLIIAALYDRVTGLPNRAMFRDYFAKALARAEREKHNLVLLFLDLDGFKAINDTHGHQAGDALLCVVAERLMVCVRAGDLASRFGGDEFTIILENCQPSFLPVIADRFIQALESPIELEGQVAKISASLGIVVYPEHGTEEETLIRRADEAMYCVKKEGKSGYKIWHSS
jgi:diguanylate cyclase (GGDEF)-like protein